MPNIGDIIKVKVIKLLNNGAILSASDSYDYFLPVREVSENNAKHIKDLLEEGQTIDVRVTGRKRHRGKISFQTSIRLLNEELFKKDKFDKKMKDFMKSSDEIQQQVRKNKERKQNGKKIRPNK